MANQKELNVYIFKNVCAAFAEYDPEDGEKEISCAEAAEALQHTIRKIQNLPMRCCLASRRTSRTAHKAGAVWEGG